MPIILSPLLGAVQTACSTFGHTKEDQFKILSSLSEELGELSAEVRIAHGEKSGEPGKDGIVGEAVDLILGALDMIYSETGSLNEPVITDIVRKKCEAWITKHKR